MPYGEPSWWTNQYTYTVGIPNYPTINWDWDWNFYYNGWPYVPPYVVNPYINPPPLPSVNQNLYQFQVAPASFEFVLPEVTLDFETETVESKQSLVCPDCRGTKEYVGLNKKEPCATCKGNGTL